MNGWKTVKLREVATIDRSSIQPEQIKSGTIYVGLEHIESGGSFLGIEHVDAGVLSSTKFQFTEHHVLYGKLRPYLAKIACPEFSGICSTDILPILPGPEIERRYLSHFLRQPSMIDYASSLAVGANLPRLSPSVLEDFLIPLPPLEEQKRIADILDRAEALRAKRRAALDQLDELVQSIFIEMFGDPVINPMGWNTKKLEKLCVKIFGGGTPSKSKPEYYEGSIPWVTPKDMKQDFIQDSIDHISAQAVEESSTKLIPPNCLLMVIRSGILKKKLPVAINICEVTMNQDMKGFVFDNKFTNSYFMLYFFKIYQRDLLNRIRSVTADNLEFDQIKDINVIVPPIEKQQIFAHCVAAVGKLKTTHEASLAELNELFASLQYRAFRDELSMTPKTAEQSSEGVKI